MASSKTPGLKREQVQKAVAALLKYVDSQKEGSKDLLEDEEYLYLVSSARQKHAVNGQKRSVSPDSGFCLICRT